MKKRRHIIALVMILCLTAALTSCYAAGKTRVEAAPAAEPETAAPAPESPAAALPETPGPVSSGADGAAAEQNGETYILFTSDVHCGVDRGFGYVGLQQIRDTLEAAGFTTILVDDGDAIQGESIGTLTRGEAVIDLMNALHYDVAIPGNHEFDFGMDQFLALAERAEFPYISCNFTYLDELVFDPYVILEASGVKIAFVGVTTPETVTSSTPAIFMNGEGEYVYGFMRDETGESVYAAVQSAVDAARSEGAELVYVMGHMGNAAYSMPWTYADVIEHTRGIDVFLDGHSHDVDQVVMKNMDGEDVVRSAVGTKLSCIGYSHISAEGEILETGIWSWPNDEAAPELLGLNNAMSGPVDAALASLDALTGRTLAQLDYDLTIFDPVEVDAASGNPIRMVRRAETNMGDFCADVIRAQSGADVALIGGGGVRSSVQAGSFTYGDIISVWPYGNTICIIEATGQQILDALEWGARALPGEHGAFMQVSGLSYEIDVSVPSGCSADGNGLMTGIEGERRVRNVTVGGEPIDPEKAYTVAGQNYWMLEHGDGVTAFDGARVVQESIGVDNLIMLDYLTNVLGGVIGGDYADPYGQGRIVIIDTADDT